MSVCNICKTGEEISLEIQQHSGKKQEYLKKQEWVRVVDLKRYVIGDFDD